MKCDNWDIGLCSWSLQTSIADVAETMTAIGIDHVHLALGPAIKQDGRDYLSFARQHQWTISATMIDFPQEDYSTLDSIKLTGGLVPDASFPANKQLFLAAANITKDLGVRYLSMHAGFIDHTQPEKYRTIRQRIESLADIAADNSIMLLMETGQETAEEMADFLNELNHPALGINFDPANMILYDKGDPVNALSVLSPWIKHVHIKDAAQTITPGQWGTEVPWADGQVKSETFLTALKQIQFQGTLAIEREAGDNRAADIKLAADRLRLFHG